MSQFHSPSKILSRNKTVDSVISPQTSPNKSIKSVKSMNSTTKSKEKTTSPKSDLVINDTSLSAIKVVVRIRPLLQKEIENGVKSCCDCRHNSVITITKLPAIDTTSFMKSNLISSNEYQYDNVFDHTASQIDVFNNSVRAYLSQLFLGLNLTVFAYGATSSGKTHTMIGNLQNLEYAGIIPNTMKELFHIIQQKEIEKQQIDVRVSYLEIYNEHVYDLLVEKQDHMKGLQLREDPVKGIVIVAGLTETKAKSYDEVIQLLLFGNTNRKTEATMANQVSSRSHAVFQLTLCINKLVSKTNQKLESKLSLIDLAGSERASVTNNRGVRLIEGANINRSLLALGNCINALAENNLTKRKGNVKYRDSKLTHLLKSSLEGQNAYVVMIANINPSHWTYEDTHNTLKYANRAKNIKVDKPHLLVDENDFVYKEKVLNQRIESLTLENTELRQHVIFLEKIVIELQGNLNFISPARKLSIERDISEIPINLHDDNDEYHELSTSSSQPEELDISEVSERDDIHCLDALGSPILKDNKNNFVTTDISLSSFQLEEDESEEESEEVVYLEPSESQHDHDDNNKYRYENPIDEIPMSDVLHHQSSCNDEYNESFVETKGINEVVLSTNDTETSEKKVDTSFIAQIARRLTPPRSTKKKEKDKEKDKDKEDTSDLTTSSNTTSSNKRTTSPKSNTVLIRMNNNQVNQKKKNNNSNLNHRSDSDIRPPSVPIVEASKHQSCFPSLCICR